MRLSSKMLLSATALTLLSISAAAKAETLTLIASSTAFPGYPAIDATDGSLITDFAGNGTGVGTFLTYALSGGPVDSVSLYDRTTSGSGNDGFSGGLRDYTSKFTLTFYTDASLTTEVASYDFTKPVPSTPTDIDSFFYTADFAPVSAGVVVYTVDAISGDSNNPGLANFSLSGPAATPEPGSLALLGTGIAGLAAMRRRFIK